MRIVLTSIAFFLLSSTSPAAEPTYLYDAQFVQAAPGKLLALIDHYKARMTSYASAGDEPPLWIRHSQGDKWDLMLLFPMGSYAEYYRPEREARRESAERSFKEKLKELVAWQEDLFVYGPPVSDLRGAFSKGAFFHLEIFHALPGKKAELHTEREMENAYQRALARPENFIFVRDTGASWDLFTLGVYRDLKHYAESADIPAAQQEAAAKKAGFEASSRIGPYLRALIADHHDTLAVAVK
ncbi:MAG TPA: hypothetical protein VLM38_04680 [Blastocatellia bacterium]|nr:hypothetical protein [Blastocatellia bacterium]